MPFGGAGEGLCCLAPPLTAFASFISGAALAPLAPFAGALASTLLPPFAAAAFGSTLPPFPAAAPFFGLGGS